jgi:phospholipase C
MWGRRRVRVDAQRTIWVWMEPITAATTRLRGPGALPYPSQPIGQYTGAFPFDHIVLVMQENHSFDNYLGMLPVSGQPKAGRLHLQQGRASRSTGTRVGNERMYVYHQSGDIGAQDSGASRGTTRTSRSPAAMNGFAGTGPGSMGYYTEDDLPFYYSLAKTFTLANRWFCSVPAQTYPNRRFFMAGTASGIVSTDIDNVTTYPPNGTIWDR